MSRSVLWAGVGILIGLMAMLVGFTLARPYTFRGSLIEPPIPAVDFTLTGPQGRDFSLRDQAGKLVMVFFGYTSCPDVCPATLSEMKQIRQLLGKQSEDVRFVFITVDPQRDTPERMGQYTAAFDPAIVGLTGSEEQLSQVWQDYGVYRAVGESDSAGGYSVDHTARIYLIDQTGNLRLTYPFGFPVDEILQDVRYLLRN